ncbi:MAG TPA: NUDIX domain-containing protein [Candidatus Bathyarchaeia archaeon]|nr:NUDIX domain-containing protein [Candidatus Bathyarchaeia archaeon]
MKKSNTNLIKFKREFSAGCVVFKRESKGVEVKFLLGKHSGYHKWVLPKGLIEKGERGWQTAVRETEEEMGVKARLLDEKPLHQAKYVYMADFKDLETQTPNQAQSTRRVMVYQEQGGSKIRVFKTVSFYLAEYQSGKSKDHGWEMSEAGWYGYKKAFKMLAFKAEKQALQKAKEKIREIEKQQTLI